MKEEGGGGAVKQFSGALKHNDFPAREDQKKRGGTKNTFFRAPVLRTLSSVTNPEKRGPRLFLFKTGGNLCRTGAFSKSFLDPSPSSPAFLSNKTRSIKRAFRAKKREMDDDDATTAGKSSNEEEDAR